MTSLRTTRKFDQDVKRMQRRRKDLRKLWSTVERLLAGERLGPGYRPHRLSGRWERAWECHIEPDWLLIWQLEGDQLKLVRTGTHSDLFG